MNCPKCGKGTRVIDTRPLDDFVYRRRECKICKYIFFTEECESIEINGNYYANNQIHEYWRRDRAKRKAGLNNGSK